MGCEVQVRHAAILLFVVQLGVHGLLGGSVSQPRLEIGTVQAGVGRSGGQPTQIRGAVLSPQFEGAAGKGCSTHEMRKIRGDTGNELLVGLVCHDRAVGVGQAVHLMAAGAVGGEHFLALGRHGVLGRLCRVLLLVGDPCVEVVLRQRHGLHPHVRMGQAAELGALAIVNADGVGFEVEGVIAVRDRVTLAVELRDPERVDDITAGDPDKNPELVVYLHICYC